MFLRLTIVVARSIMKLHVFDYLLTSGQHGLDRLTSRLRLRFSAP